MNTARPRPRVTDLLLSSHWVGRCSSAPNVRTPARASPFFAPPNAWGAAGAQGGLLAAAQHVLMHTTHEGPLQAVVTHALRQPHVTLLPAPPPPPAARRLHVVIMWLIMMLMMLMMMAVTAFNIYGGGRIGLV